MYNKYPDKVLEQLVRMLVGLPASNSRYISVLATEYIPCYDGYVYVPLRTRTVLVLSTAVLLYVRTISSI